MNGREVFRDIRSIDPQAKVLMSSGFARDAGVSELMKEGLSGFLKKPYHRNELARALDEILT
jgi:DNA-binding NarL/FixJ family response regulator